MRSKFQSWAANLIQRGGTARLAIVLTGALITFVSASQSSYAQRAALHSAFEVDSQTAKPTGAESGSIKLVSGQTTAPAKAAKPSTAPATKPSPPKPKARKAVLPPPEDPTPSAPEELPTLPMKAV